MVYLSVFSAIDLIFDTFSEEEKAEGRIAFLFLGVVRKPFRMKLKRFYQMIIIAWKIL